MANNCMCQEAGVLVFSCSGCSDVGELSDRVARKISKCGQAKMACLSGIGAHISGMVASAKSASKLIAIDGCPVLCSKKIIEHAGLKPISYCLKDLGFEKSKVSVDEAAIEKAASKIMGGKVEEVISRDSDGCCSG